MKKYLIGFIIAMISIIPISSASASDAVSVSYGNETWTFNQPEYYGYKYGMFIYQDGGFGYEYYFLSNEPLAYSTSYVVISTYDDVVVSTYKYKRDSISTNLTLNNFSNRTGNYGLNMSNYKILWSNYNVPEVTFDTYNGASTVYYSTGNISHACNADECVLVGPVELNINITSNNACDLAGTEIKVVNIDFAEVYDESYIYQYKTDFSDWIDVTTQVNDAALYDYYYYQFNLYYNTTVQARVLDSFGNVIVENSIDITDLRNYETIYNYRNSFSSSEINNLGTIDFYVNFDELNVSHNFRLEYYSNDYELSNIPKFKSYKGYLVDVYGFKLDYDFNEYFEVSYEEYKLFESDYTVYLDGVVTQIKELPDKAYGYRLSFEFDNINNYTFNVFDDYAKETIWDYTLDFLNDYTKIYFPKDYNVAIIRSKNFKDLTTSMIVPNINLINSDYRYLLYYYDFINYNDTNILDIDKLDIDNYKVNISIDETNNIFPIIYKDSSKEDLHFYIKNDCYVHFYSSENLESYIVGLDDEIYNDNNDLNINNNFNDFIDNSGTKDVDGFFSTFKNAFENFKEVVLEIVDNIRYFYETLNVDLRNFYIVIFGLILFGFLIRFIL